MRSDLGFLGRCRSCRRLAVLHEARGKCEGCKRASRRTVALVVVVLLALVVHLAGCAPGGEYRPGVYIEGDAPAEFREEAAAAGRVLGITWPVAVRVERAPFACAASPTGLCAGEAVGQVVRVVYAPELGLGPALGSTALEHELCHAVGLADEGAASRCASEVVRRLAEVPHA